VELLLDTHIFLRWHENNPRLASHFVDLISDPENRAFVSAASIWEIATKRRIGKLAFEGSPVAAVNESRLSSAPIHLTDAEAAGDLAWAHKDPFDRLLVVQAQRLGATLVTADAVLRTAPAAILWAG